MAPNDSNHRGWKRDDTPAFFSEGSAVDPTLLVPPVGVGEGDPVVYARK